MSNLKDLYNQTVTETTLEMATEANTRDVAIRDAKRGFVAHLRGGRKVADMVSQVLTPTNGRSEYSEYSENVLQA
jgi:hypothetical protein